jgi:hypothetical protein
VDSIKAFKLLLKEGAIEKKAVDRGGSAAGLSNSHKLVFFSTKVCTTNGRSQSLK